MQHFIAIDLGTTHSKAVIADGQGSVMHVAKANVVSLIEEDGAHTQDAEAIYNNVVQLLQESCAFSVAAGARIACVSFSAAMHSFLAVDSSGKPLMPAMTWADSRSKKYAQQLRPTEQGKDIYKNTGTAIHTMSPLCKLLWLKNERPALFNEAAKFISIKEYICFRLFDTYIIDEGIASATGLYNIYSHAWHTPSLMLAGIDEQKLSAVVATTHVETNVNATVKQMLALPYDVPFVMGGNDGCLANLGCGALTPGTAVLTLGTSGAVRLTIPAPAIKPLNGLFRYILTKDLYVTGGPINNGGAALEWFATNMLQKPLNEGDNFNDVMQLAATADAASEGVFFQPYLLGERAPVWDEDSCGIFYGLKAHHKPAHLTRAVIEGISFSLLQIMQNIEQQNNDIGAVYISGFVTQSDFWLQLLADMFGKKVILNDIADASALGAAFIGMTATGFVKDITDVKQFISTDKVFHPNPAVHGVYEKSFRKYLQIYPAMQHISKEIM
ncbi:gluconokinase [Panacibacter sp. DH6]|uniref:Gluconokinase n=1 Tax=Panacibacter microcysteis TaxID=2793269 RepID=A0A931GZN5_9BACT|nr:gluconokinase [Panacibacter microcysteis]MBG9378304.1 gluconokinase [Panacibacter microcysteis]